MPWEKKGLIFKPKQNHEWMQAYATVPTPDLISPNNIRIYFGTRDSSNRSHITYLEADASNPNNISYLHNEPILTPGEIGCFDDCGVMPSWVVNHNGYKYLYYTGWNVRNTISYHNSIGLAISEDDGKNFKRLSQGPVIDRNFNEPHFSAIPCILIENNVWRMWYLSCVKWVIFNDRPEPFYHIKYAESSDGIEWKRKGVICIDFKDENECGLVRPCVIKDGNKYRMWYSFRNLQNYRTNIYNSYRIGYAESDDGIKWIRKDNEVGISISSDGWDSSMIEYPFVYEYKKKKIMLYNGNNFGESGFGFAILRERGEEIV
ncbi:hypothetical protein [Paenibacillus oleatilyticus]|uniref:hypothetical protein n=1 Tax=Paenibacillus oleatilyticus TaxID=2594886 RepID=UPI001C1F2098|nr:hypothetical protein [Paenibacillus oleatilyticus]MBU7317614.1 hypothetical protein [Paenibacillus oleatilyticus]